MHGGFEEYFQEYRRLSLNTYFMITIVTYSLEEGYDKSVNTFLDQQNYCTWLLEQKGSNYFENHTLTKSADYFYDYFQKISVTQGSRKCATCK